MKISGFQKMTLLDYPGKVACTIFTSGCNLRCPFCHNASLVTKIDHNNYYNEEEILKYLEGRKNLLDGVCITGGEPLLQNDIYDFIKKIKDMGYLVKLDTNGTNPKKLIELAEKKVIDYVAMDIKNSKEKYALTSGIENLDINNIEESVNFLLSDSVDYEFRTTVVDVFHDTQDIEKIAMWIGGAKRYFLQNFVDSGDLIGDKMGSVGEETLNKMCSVARKYVENTIIRGV
ncbi:MAG: anaerobic ribonucleoside-triphosphate reductase activating protein [Ruminococcaceae bacterium]|nr:anaerobic ribonucleoside-triphosphate reductase activating protein [Oscillospiraceae bacterium]